MSDLNEKTDKERLLEMTAILRITPKIVTHPPGCGESVIIPPGASNVLGHPTSPVWYYFDQDGKFVGC